MSTRTYRYIGDRLTSSQWKGARCEAVLDQRGKCIRGRNGNMLVRFCCGTQVIVLGRLLRKIEP